MMLFPGSQQMTSLKIYFEKRTQAKKWRKKEFSIKFVLLIFDWNLYPI